MLSVLRVFLLLTYLLFLEIKKAVVGGGKLAVSTTWSPAGASGGTSDLQITSATTGALETGCNCRSINFALTGEEYKGELKWGSLAINISAAAVAEGVNKGVAIKLSPGMTIVYSGAPLLKFSATYTAEPLFITSNGKKLPAMEFAGAAAASYKLADAADLGPYGVTLAKGTFDTNGQKLEAASLVSNEALTRTLTLGASTIKLTGTGVVWNLDPSVGTLTFSGASSTIEFSGAEPIFYGGGAESPPKYGTIIMSGTKCTVGSAATGVAKSIEVATLQLNATQNAIVKSQAVKIGTALTTNATSGTKKKLNSSEAGTQGLLDLGGKTITLENLEVRDIFIVSGTLNLINCVNLGNNSAEAGAHVNFITQDAASGTVKAKGAGSELYGAKDARTATAKASGTSFDALKASDKPTGGPKAGGVRSDAYKAIDARSGGVVSGGTAADHSGAADSGAGGAMASGTATSSYKAADARSGGVTATGTRAESLTKADARSGGAKAAGSFSQAYKATDARSGGAKAVGSKTESWAHLGFFFDERNGTVHAGGTRADAYKAADVSHGAAKASSTARDVYKATDTRAGSVTASGTRLEQAHYTDARGGAVHLLGTSVASQTTIDARSGTAHASGSSTTALQFTDARDGIAHLLGSSAESYTTPLKPALVTVRMRHSALIRITVRRSTVGADAWYVGDVPRPLIEVLHPVLLTRLPIGSPPEVLVIDPDGVRTPLTAVPDAEVNGAFELPVELVKVGEYVGIVESPAPYKEVEVFSVYANPPDA